MASPLFLMRPESASALRVLAYHAVEDVENFRRQMEVIRTWFRPIGESQALKHFQGASLRDRSCWVTFDDGDPSVIDAALPVLRDLAIPATMFICPSVVDTWRPFWWTVVQAAARREIKIEGELVDDRTLLKMKELPDRTRRLIVSRLAEAIEMDAGEPLRQRQVTSSQLKSWVDAGMTVGNHTWDHPILTRCSADEEEHQVLAAHDWIQQSVGRPRCFAYPNGDVSRNSVSILQELEYGLGLLFDHKVARNDEPFGVSRIRVNASDDLAEFRARVSGIHTIVHGFRGNWSRVGRRAAGSNT